MATPSDAKPTYIYKLVSSSAVPPDPLPDRLPVSDLDQTSGFIHLSTARQIPNTLKFFYKDEDRVYVLRIPYDPVEKNIKWEDPKAEACGPRGGEGMFPHLYNEFKLGNDEVESVQSWEKGPDGWDSALQSAQAWLAY
ncbi:hypothetical protein DEU56DRAFT_462664 [Suillus clintonianus]|uniref:uncharacterized protein n=1 Tax=Suillus clintonianus TaxID=1904413 RepID=UPI001B8831A7|nr:uncharacterized protein DEU56DRAFT_462664 [Suillus clintonianus]KAG2130886.1 hypothetical protein DEU56DRAFT_462664 [Suillus clintonianus]